MLLAIIVAVQLGCASASIQRSESSKHGALEIESPSKLMRRQEIRIDGSAKLTKVHSQRAKDFDMCNLDYIYGVEHTGECTGAGHDIILQQAMCKEAAAEHKITVPSERTFALESDWFHMHPKGCFKGSCSESPEGVCYFFNGVEPDPDCKAKSTCQGTPVCSRPRFLWGTDDTNGVCPTGYKVLKDEEECSAAADCLDSCAGGEFVIGVQNMSKIVEYPEGCFRDNTLVQGCLKGTFFYNPGNTLMGTPTHPKGTPLCVVETWSKDETASARRAARHAAHKEAAKKKAGDKTKTGSLSEAKEGDKAKDGDKAKVLF